jgi:hypothetical protein
LADGVAALDLHGYIRAVFHGVPFISRARLRRRTDVCRKPRSLVF